MKPLPYYMRDPDKYSVYADNLPYVVLDLETTNKEKGSALVPDNRVVCAAWYCGNRKVHYHRGDELDQKALLACLKIVADTGGFLVAHHAKFELQWLQRAGFDIGSILVYDTQIGEYVISGNRMLSLSLDATCKRYGMAGKMKKVDRWMKAGVCPSDMPPEYLKARVVQDVKDTLRLFHKQRARLRRRGQIHLAFTRNIFCTVLADMETRGIALDSNEVTKRYYDAQRELLETREEFRQIFGNVNFNSPTQVAKLLYEDLKFPERKYRDGRPVRNKPTKQFPEGLPKTDAATVEGLTARNEKQRRFQELYKRLNSLSSLLSKNLEFFMGVVKERDGVFHVQFNQTVTRTHRLSSSGRRQYFERTKKEHTVQGQNMPNELKPCIRAKREGYVIADTDASQLEFRVGAFISQDEQMREDIDNNVDQHVFAAKEYYHLSDEDWERLSDDEKYGKRRYAKRETFKPLYGGTRGTPAQEAYYKAWQEKFWMMVETQDQWCAEVLRFKHLTMPWGMRWYFPYCRLDGDYIVESTKIKNYPVQSLATGEMIPIGVTYLWHRIRQADLPYELVLTVHDSVVAEIPDNTLDRAQWAGLSASCLVYDTVKYLAAVYGLDWNVKLGVEWSIGPNWDGPDNEKGGVEVNPSTIDKSPLFR